MNIDIKDYGKIISTREYIVDKNTGDISSFVYLGADKETNYTKGTLEIFSDLTEINSDYEVDVNHNMKFGNKRASINFKTKGILSLDKYINYINNMIGNNKSLPGKTYRYDTASIKTEDNYEVEITFGDNDIIMGPFNKDDELLVDGNQMIVSNNDTVKAIYVFSKYGYRISYISDDKSIDAVSIIDFSSNNGTRSFALSNIKKNPSILSRVTELSYIPSHIVASGKMISFEYDKYGILIHSSDNNTIYEDSHFKGKTDNVIMSLHPLYFDIFDSSLVNNGKLYCFDQLEYEYDYDCMRYVRAICEVDDDKLEKLSNDMKSDVFFLSMVDTYLN